MIRPWLVTAEMQKEGGSEGRQKGREEGRKEGRNKCRKTRMQYGLARVFVCIQIYTLFSLFSLLPRGQHAAVE